MPQRFLIFFEQNMNIPNQSNGSCGWEKRFFFFEKRWGFILELHGTAFFHFSLQLFFPRTDLIWFEVWIYVVLKKIYILLVYCFYFGWKKKTNSWYIMESGAEYLFEFLNKCQQKSCIYTAIVSICNAFIIYQNYTMLLKCWHLHYMIKYIHQNKISVLQMAGI